MMNEEQAAASLEAGRRLVNEVLQPMKRDFVGKDEIIDLLGVCMVGGENLFILGPPGTAKSALVHRLGQSLHGKTFVYLLTRFTEPNELFGPFDIRKLREGQLSTNTEGMLSEASLVFLDELLNANSAILNSLLTVLNERTLHRGRELIPVEALLFVGASNHLPEDDALQALFDRFLLRVRCDNVPEEDLGRVLEMGWKMEKAAKADATVTFQDIHDLQEMLPLVNLDAIRKDYVELVQRIRTAGIRVSDRRAVKLQKLIAASALICGRWEARLSDLWILRYIWDVEEQQETLRALVHEVVSRDQESNDGGTHHIQSGSGNLPDPEALARDLEWVEENAGKASGDGGEDVSLQLLRDRLAMVESRLPWVESLEHRDYLGGRTTALWKMLEKPAGAVANG